jgi:hypothetical protein
MWYSIVLNGGIKCKTSRKLSHNIKFSTELYVQMLHHCPVLKLIAGVAGSPPVGNGILIYILYEMLVLFV